jgi:hypothetical protein
MNSKDWHKGFEAPEGLGATDVAWLEQAVASFPYSAALHALYAKALKNENHYLAPQALRRAAVVSPNRRSLMAWMEGADFGVSRQDARPISPEGARPNSILAPSEGTDVGFAHDAPVREVAVPDVPVSIIPERKVPTAPAVPVSQPVSTPAAEADLSHLPEKVREAILRSRAISSRLHPQEGLSSIPNPAQNTPPAVSPPSVHPTTTTERDNEVAQSEGLMPHVEVAHNAAHTPVPEPVQPRVSAHAESPPMAHSPFAQWLAQQTGQPGLSHGSGHSGTESAGAPGTPSSIKEEQGSIGESESWEESQSVVSKPDANALIDKFLEREGPLRPNQTQRRNGDLPAAQVDLSASSLGGDPVFMTETLAQLYLQQGAFDKAVQAYEILRLKYPEKSAIFAAQILEIRLTQRNKKP